MTHSEALTAILAKPKPQRRRLLVAFLEEHTRLDCRGDLPEDWHNRLPDGVRVDLIADLGGPCPD